MKSLKGKRARIKPGDYGQFAARDYINCEGTIVADYRRSDAYRTGYIKFPLCINLDIEELPDGYPIAVREEWLEILEPPLQKGK